MKRLIAAATFSLLFPIAAHAVTMTFSNITGSADAGVVQVQALKNGAKSSVQVPFDNRTGIWKVWVSADGTNYVNYANYSTGEYGIYNPSANVDVPLKIKLEYVDEDTTTPKNATSAAVTVED